MRGVGGEIEMVFPILSSMEMHFTYVVGNEKVIKFTYVLRSPFRMNGKLSITFEPIISNIKYGVALHTRHISTLAWRVSQ